MDKLSQIKFTILISKVPRIARKAGETALKQTRQRQVGEPGSRNYATGY